MSMPGPFEMILIFLAVLLIFGAKRIPEIARGLGKGIREFKDATTDIKRELTVDDQNRINPPRPPQQQGYAQQPYGQQQPYQPQGQQPYQPAPPPPQAPPSSLTEPAYPQGTSYGQPAPDGNIDTPQPPRDPNA